MVCLCSGLGSRVIGATMLNLASVFSVRNSYGLGFGFGSAIAGLISAYYLSDRINDFLLRLIGLTSMIYVPLDVFSDTLTRPHLHSDARILADLVGGSTQMWGFLCWAHHKKRPRTAGVF